jgi:Flp pilus assembly protein TadG
MIPTELDPPRVRGDRGGVLVETALVAPFLFLLLMGLFDFGLFSLRQSQLSSAARDGARAGIITWDGADGGTYAGGACPSSPPSFASICTSALKRLAGSTATGVTVTCYDGTTTTVKACASGVIVEGIDTMKVAVSYRFLSMTPVGQTFLPTNKTYNSSATMVIQ